jgi:predicted kinase
MEDEMKRVIIMRGLPGSGKSTVAKLFERHHYVSMDLFWTKDGGEYEFDYARLNEAIAWVHQQFMNALREEGTGTDLIVVDNVNYAHQHFMPFVNAAREAGAVVHFVHVERPLVDLESSHGVPEDKILQMADKWEHIL